MPIWAIETVSEYIGEHILVLPRGGRDRLHGAYAIFTTQLFHIFNLTISDTLVHIKKTIAGTSYFKDGIKTILYFYEELGPGDKLSRTGTRIGILRMKQNPEESVREFGDRMKFDNDSLVKPIEAETLVVIFAQGLLSHEIRQHLAGKMSEKEHSLEQIIKVAEQYGKNLELTGQDGIDGFQAQLRGKGSKGKGSGGRPNPYGGRGRGNGTDNRMCDVCQNKWHFWRQCFYVNWQYRRPNTTEENHNKLDQKCNEFLAQRSTTIQNNVREFQRTLPTRVPQQVAGALAEPILEFPNVEGKLAVVNSPVAEGNAQLQDHFSDVVSTLIRYTVIFIKALLALLLSSGGIVLLLSLFSLGQMALRWTLRPRSFTSGPRRLVVLLGRFSRNAMRPSCST